MNKETDEEMDEEISRRHRRKNARPAFPQSTTSKLHEKQTRETASKRPSSTPTSPCRDINNRAGANPAFGSHFLGTKSRKRWRRCNARRGTEATPFDWEECKHDRRFRWPMLMGDSMEFQVVEKMFVKGNWWIWRRWVRKGEGEVGDGDKGRESKMS